MYVALISKEKFFPAAPWVYIRRMQDEGIVGCVCYAAVHKTKNGEWKTLSEYSNVSGGKRTVERIKKAVEGKPLPRNFWLLTTTCSTESDGDIESGVGEAFEIFTRSYNFYMILPDEICTRNFHPTRRIRRL